MIIGNEWLASLPNNPCLERDQLILDAVQSGQARCNWVSVTSTIPNHTAIFQVCDDAVWIDLDDGSRFRFQVSARLAQQCADAMDVSFTTAKICDLAYQQADIKLAATILPAGPEMVTTARSITFNEALEKKRNGAEGLIRDCGKAWILDNALKFSAGAVNYGFYDPHAAYVNPHGIKMWQNIGTKHNQLHTDYSQVLILMKKQCVVDGQDSNISSIAADKTLSYLLNYDGVLHYTAQP